MMQHTKINLNEPSNINLLLGLPLNEALNLLENYNISTIETSANTVLNKKISKDDYCIARVINVQFNNNKVLLTYSFFKDDVK
ncbi:MAG: hypothetical protein GYA87_07060 [Christensenellaceae bacterium]|nr:hypothetical protein [Christensenellaceae bacterium]